MSQPQCPFEERVAAASRSGQSSDELRAHIAGCRACEELALVAGYLHASAEEAGFDAPLPSVDCIWQAAQHSARAAVMERALRPIVWARRIAFGTCAAVLIAAIVTWRLPLAIDLRNFVQFLDFRTASDSAARDSVPFLFAAAFVVFLVPLIFGLYSAWAED